MDLTKKDAKVLIQLMNTSSITGAMAEDFLKLKKKLEAIEEKGPEE